MRLAITCGALSGFIAVILSAWAAHGLGDIVSAEDLERIKIGTELQLWHALALLTVTEHGQVITGPFFLLEKKSPGFNPKTGDWLFMMIRPDGRVAGITGGRNSGNVTFCAACHTKAPKGQDGLYFLPREVRR